MCNDLTMVRRRVRSRGNARRGAVTVEFAVVAPVFITIILGLTQACRILHAQNALTEAVRDGARVAAMERADFLNPGQTTNQKITQDVRKPDPHYQKIQRNNLRARYHADPDYLQDSVELSPQARSHR